MEAAQQFIYVLLEQGAKFIIDMLDRTQIVQHLYNAGCKIQVPNDSL